MTSVSCRLPKRSWPSLAVIGCLTDPHTLVFSPPSIKPQWRRLSTLFQEDLVKRTPPLSSPGGLWDRMGHHWLIMDVDATKQAARQRALPQLDTLPAPHRRVTQVCAAGYRGRKRGEVVRTRTPVLQAFTHQWIGTDAGAGNGDYRGELQRALEAITAYATAQGPIHFK